MNGGYALACLLVSFLYLTLGSISIFMFGSSVQSSVLESVANECKEGGSCPWESVVLRIMFLVVIACHIPFVFFSGKEGILIVIDELDRRSISKALEKKLGKIDNLMTPKI
jgi:hypothetical protein